MARKAVPFTQVDIHDGFWKPRMRVLSEVTLPTCLDRCDRTGRIANFRRAAGLEEGEFKGIFFDDSDVYKVLEGVAYSLQTNPDPQLEARADAVIDAIAAAQQQDGYLFCFFTLNTPQLRWTDMDKHEMYCAGHLIEAAIAYDQATGKSQFLQVARRLADHLDDTFGEGKRHWVPGHEEIELALMKLYRYTGEARYLTLAKFLLEERGRGHGRGRIWQETAHFGAAYAQDDVPVAEQRIVRGHAVRAMYLYTAMADAMAEGSAEDYMPALLALYENVAERNMYITGGIGSSASNEGFTNDYDLPNDTAYCETCASVGMVYWNHRMNLLTGEGKYADVAERAMYNGVLAGYGLRGDLFFYDNPLSSDGQKHRSEWFDCSCCPTQLARFIPAIGAYQYVVDGNEAYVNLYMQSSAHLALAKQTITLNQQTAYPWSGEVRIVVEETDAPFTMRLRLPEWCPSFSLLVNGRAEPFEKAMGYLAIQNVRAGDEILFVMDMPVMRMVAKADVLQDAGKVALQRGPLVYCVEEVDQHIPREQMVLRKNVPISYGFDSTLLGGVVTLEAENMKWIPYCLWNNRAAGTMDVWIPCRAEEEQLYRRG